MKIVLVNFTDRPDSYGNFKMKCPHCNRWFSLHENSAKMVELAMKGHADYSHGNQDHIRKGIPICTVRLIKSSPIAILANRFKGLEDSI